MANILQWNLAAHPEPLFSYRRRSSRLSPAWFRVSVSSPLLGGYDLPETLPYEIRLNCPVGADVGQVALEVDLNLPQPRDSLFGL